MATGILGGTFDPVHVGHVAIARSFIESEEIGELWIMPSPDPPHKQSRDITPFPIRMELLEIAFKSYDRIFISDYENHLPRPSYTVLTVESLKRDYPDRIFKLCMGSDSLKHIRDWYEYKKLLKLCPFLVASRPGYNTTSLPEDIRNNCTFVEHEEVSISSTNLKQSLTEGPGAWKWIPEEVKKRIRELGLYRN